MIELGILDGQYYARDTLGSGRWYRIGMAWTLFPTCPCGAARFGDCKHVLAYLEHRTRKELAMADSATAPSTALVVPSRVANTRALAESKREVLALGRAGYDDALVLGKGFVQAGLYGLGPNDGVKAAIIIMTAADLQIPASQAFQYIAIIKGKPMLQARMVGALILRSGQGKILTVTRAADRAVVRAIRDGVQTDFEITMEMARKAGWTANELYAKVPANMLWARAITTAGWAVFPDVLAGMDMTEGEEVLEGFSPDAAYHAPVVVDSVEPADLGAPPEQPVAEAPPAEGEYREIPPETAQEPQDAPRGPKGPSSSDQAFVEELGEMGNALQKTWNDIAEALGTARTKSAFIKWRAAHPEIADHVSYARDRLLGVPLPNPQASFADELEE